MTTTRIQQDLREEVCERFESTNYEMFAYDDRKLFDITLDTLLEKPTSHLYAWCESVDIAVRSSSTLTQSNDQSQRLLTQPPSSQQQERPIVPQKHIDDTSATPNSPLSGSNP